MESKIKYEYINENFSMYYKNHKSTGYMPPHTHNAVEIYLNLSYLPAVLLHSKVLPLEKDVLIIFPAYSIHQLPIYLNKAYERYVLTVNTIWLDAILDSNDERYQYLKNPEHPLTLPVNTEQKAKLIQCFENLIHYKDNDTFSKLSYFFETMSLIHELVNTSGTADTDTKDKISASNKTVNDIIEYINNHIHENLQIVDIAHQFFLNPDYISRIFKKHTSITISNYITIQRISKARKLLSDGDSISEVLLKTGYSSYSYFFRIFKKMVGMSPREFRDLYYKK